MSVNPAIFILIGALCAALSVFTAILTLLAESKRIRNELTERKEQLKLRLEELQREAQALKSQQSVTRSQSTINIAVSSMFQHT